jgi:hypothetical protein
MTDLKWPWLHSDEEGGSPTGRGTLLTERKPDHNGFYRAKEIRGNIDEAKIEVLAITGMPYR